MLVGFRQGAETNKCLICCVIPHMHLRMLLAKLMEGEQVKKKSEIQLCQAESPQGWLLHVTVFRKLYYLIFCIPLLVLFPNIIGEFSAGKSCSSYVTLLYSFTSWKLLLVNIFSESWITMCGNKT